MICDDGSKSGVLALCNFTFQEVKEFSDYLSCKPFGIENRHGLLKGVKNGINYPIIFIKKNGRDRIIELAENFDKELIEKSMRYKFYKVSTIKECQKLNSFVDFEKMSYLQYFEWDSLNCILCDVSFKLKTLIHYQNVHCHSYECERCGNYFANKDALYGHKKHSYPNYECMDLIKYECDYCHLKFISNQILVHHIKIEHIKKDKEIKVSVCTLKYDFLLNIFIK